MSNKYKYKYRYKYKYKFSIGDVIRARAFWYQDKACTIIDIDKNGYAKLKTNKGREVIIHLQFLKPLKK